MLTNLYLYIYIYMYIVCVYIYIYIYIYIYFKEDGKLIIFSYVDCISQSNYSRFVPF